jgi:hypothetical protein
VQRAINELVGWGLVRAEQMRLLAGQRFAATQYTFLFEVADSQPSSIPAVENPANELTVRKPKPKIHPHRGTKRAQPNQERNQHAFGDRNQKALQDWLAIKARLSSEWWVRPIYFLRMAGKCLLLSMPTDGRILQQARASPDLQALARDYGYEGALLTRYPDRYELQQLRALYPEQWEQIPPALKRRALERSA